MATKNTTVRPVGPAKGKTAVEAIITGVATAAVLILVNVLSCNARARIDLTENKVYSLSHASMDIVRGMPEKVNIRAYFGNVPAEHSERQNFVEMLLAEYAESSGGKIDYEKIDPWNNPQLQDDLKKEGVTKLELHSQKDDSYQQVPMYFHVVFSHLDKKEVWTPGQGFALEGLEYEFTTRIKRLGYGKKKVGVTVGFGEPQQTQVLDAPGAEVMPGVRVGLADMYEVSAVNWSTTPKSIDDLDVLIVNGPTTKVSDAAKFHLDQYIMRGKPVLFLVSGMKWQAGGNQAQQAMGDEDQPFLGMPSEAGIGDLLSTYGFDVAQNVIIDPRASAVSVIPPGSPHGMLARGFAPIAESLQSGEKQMFQGIPAVTLPFAASMKLVGPLATPSADDVVTELFKTTEKSYSHNDVMAISRQLKLNPPKDNEHGPFLVGVAVAGKFKSYYADHPAPANPDQGAAPPARGGPGGQMMMPPNMGEGEADGPEGGDAPAAPAAPAGPTGPLAASAAHTRIIVVTSPAIAADTTLTDVRTNGELVYINDFVAVHNMVDWLAEDTDLIAVRSKKVTRPLKKLETSDRAILKYGNVVGAPLLLIIFGIIFWRLRERRRNSIVL